MFEQNTSEWLEMRKNKIGASDAPVIMNVSPYKTPYRLWEEKLDLSIQDSPTIAMQRGHAMEQQAREELEKMTGLLFLPQVKFHTCIPWMMASLDGIDPENKFIAEIKCPNKEDHRKAVRGQVPEKYIPQLQHQMEVCEVEMGYYFSFDGRKGALVKVSRDDAYIKKLIEKEKKFWECIQTWTAPELTEKDYIEQTDPEWEVLAMEWKTLNVELRNMEKREKEIKDRLIQLSENKNSYGTGVKLTRFVRRGAVDYANIPELQSIDLESYRKNPSTCYKITAM